jgi:hypothetical protein
VNTRFQGPGHHGARAGGQQREHFCPGHQGERKNSGFDMPCHSSYPDSYYRHPGQQLANGPAMRHLLGW